MQASLEHLDLVSLLPNYWDHRVQYYAQLRVLKKSFWTTSGIFEHFRSKKKEILLLKNYYDYFVLGVRVYEFVRVCMYV